MARSFQTLISTNFGTLPAGYTGSAGATTSSVAGFVGSAGGGAIDGNLYVKSNTTISGNIVPTADVEYSIGSPSKRFKDLYLSGNTLYLGNSAFSSEDIFPFNLDITPEVLNIQVQSNMAGDAVEWQWTWVQSTLPYARATITNQFQPSVPLYLNGTYRVDNFAGYETFGNMTQAHKGYFKWVEGAGTDNLVSWATTYTTANVSHPDINSGNITQVQRYNFTVPSSITLPTLTPPTITYEVSVDAGKFMMMGDAGHGYNVSLGPVYRGGTYTFNLDASLAGHPFYLTTDNGTNFVSGAYVGEYTTGVTGSRNDGSAGKTTLVFQVPMNAPDSLFYQCGNHAGMRGAIVVKDLAVETNINGNYVIYFQHTHEGHKTPIELRPIPALVNQMCVVYDQTTGKFVPQDLATYVENTPSFKNKIREVAGTATLIAPNGVAVVPTVLVVEDASYLPLVNNKEGDIAFDAYYDTMYVWSDNAWRSTKPAVTTGFTGSAGAGFTGSAGAIGFTGSIGATGFTGSGGIGFTGSAGSAGGAGTRSIQLAQTGTLAVTTGTARWYAPANLSISAVEARVVTPATGSPIGIALDRNGIAIANVSIPAGSGSNSRANLSLAVSSGDYLTVDVTSVGSTTAGSDLYVMVKYIET